MKVLFYTAYEHYTPRLELEMELIEDHLQRGDEVFVIKCGGVLKTCMYNVTAGGKVLPDGNPDLDRCIKCQGRYMKGFEMAGVKPENIFDLEPLVRLGDVKFPDFQGMEDLKAYEYEGIDVGSGVASSIITLFDDYKADIKGNRRIVENKLTMAINVLKNIRRFYDILKPDLVYLFNGRFAEQRPVLTEAQRRKIEIVTHESGCNHAHFRLTRNTLPHDFDLMQVEMVELWNNAPADKFDVARSFFDNRFQGKFLLEHEKGLNVPDENMTLPEGFDPKKRNIAIFNSSLNEYEAIPGLSVGLFPSAHLALTSIFEHFLDQPDIHFYLRVHPNLAKRNNTQTREIASLNYPNLTIIPGSNKQINSYNLIRSVEKVITFVSATAPESAILGKPIISIGSSNFSQLGLAYHPKSAEELYAMIEQKLEPKPNEGALIYGYWYSKFGTPYRRLKTRSLTDGDFEMNGEKLPDKNWTPFRPIIGLRARLLRSPLKGLMKAFSGIDRKLQEALLAKFKGRHL